MKIIHSSKAPSVVGPYSQAVIAEGFVYCSGQIGLDPQTSEFTGTDIESQTKQVITNLENVLEEAGSALDKVVKTTCFLANMDDYVRFNEIYSRYFTGKPARATVEVARLPKNALVEIDVIAALS